MAQQGGGQGNTLGLVYEIAPDHSEWMYTSQKQYDLETEEAY